MVWYGSGALAMRMHNGGKINEASERRGSPLTFCDDNGEMVS